MKYFFDTEFIESFHKPAFGKRRHYIDLISIGIIDENGREYYAISNEFDFDDASDWVQENVLMPMRMEWIQSHSGDQRNRILDKIEGKGTRHTIEMMQIAIGKSNKQIMLEIREFLGGSADPNAPNVVQKDDIYGYYADYDWVLLCSLFGTMMDLPQGMPMYCRDLKQMFDEKVERREREFPLKPGNSFNWANHFKTMPTYPQQENEHNALADARWNLKLYNFLQTI